MKSLNISKSKIVEKLRKRGGETIAETLIALLIAALALTMLAGAISVSSSIVTKSRNTLRTYYETNERTVVGMKSATGQANITFASVSNPDDPDGSPDVTISLDPEAVNYFTNDTFKKSPVIAYKKKPEAAAPVTP